MSNNKTTKTKKLAEELGLNAPTISAVNTEDQKVISVPESRKSDKASADSVINNTIGASIPEELKKSEPAKKAEPKKVALYSTRNVMWDGVGEVFRGYNFVTPEQAELWLTRIHIREATPEEIKEAFDN